MTRWTDPAMDKGKSRRCVALLLIFRRHRRALFEAKFPNLEFTTAMRCV